MVQTGAGAWQWRIWACGVEVLPVLLTLQSRASGRWGLRDPILTRAFMRGSVAPILISTAALDQR